MYTHTHTHTHTHTYIYTYTYIYIYVHIIAFKIHGQAAEVVPAKSQGLDATAKQQQQVYISEFDI
jgi:hypothetical protein